MQEEFSGTSLCIFDKVSLGTHCTQGSHKETLVQTKVMLSSLVELSATCLWLMGLAKIKLSVLV